MKFAKTYEPNQSEAEIYDLWEQNHSFKPSGKGEPYSIVMPPPNANGNLHIGHGLVIALEDILTRHYRLQGRDTIYIPGSDHAGFETWTVYEKLLAKQGKSRFDFSREELYSQVWDFVQSQRGNMETQIKALGASCSWGDAVFTLDSKVVKTVYESFQKMWDEGLIYRGERIVNYCTVHQTSFADIEVSYDEEPGHLWDFAYPLTDGKGEIVVSTTRPETMLGDTAVAVHPEDDRYKHLVGKTATLPMVGREITIIADDYVDREFGTGAVKITPAHDPNDFEIGQRHNLPEIRVIGLDGKMTAEAGENYTGLTAQEARTKVLEDLESAEVLKGSQAITHSVGHCYKCGSVIEPMLMDQWFVDVKPLARRAIEALENKEIDFTPASRRGVMIRYLENLKDWNISRQIPWGIPVPAFKSATGNWVFSDQVDQQTITVDGVEYTRDSDTLDTWFSSGQWPFITTDYLTGGDLARFYPLSVMETAADILFPWVSRMIMLGLYRTNQVPFKQVYLHGLVLDEKGQKMSKSKGNVVNPMDIIGEYGSDAFRLGIVASRSAGQNQAFSTSKVIAGRNLCNKLWNIARFIQTALGEDFALADTPNTPEPTTLAEHWILSRLASAKSKIDSDIAAYRFAEAAEEVYRVIWNDVADWYIESSKLGGSPELMALVLEFCLKLIHAFAPFVSETIWQNLSWTSGVLCAETFSELPTHSAEKAAEFEQLQGLIGEIRQVISNLPDKKGIGLVYKTDRLIEDNADIIKFLGKLAATKRASDPRGLRLATSGHEAWLDISEDTLKSYKSDIEKRIAETTSEVSALDMRLSNESYVAKAPAALVEETRAALAQKQAALGRLQAELDNLA
jgi:valyl-tRNA synthetase